MLLWTFGATVIIFCCIGIFLFIRQTWLPGAITLLGTIVNGAGIARVVTQRNGAEAEERDAFKTFSEECHGNQSGALTLQSEIPSQQELRAVAWRSLFAKPT